MQTSFSKLAQQQTAGIPFPNNRAYVTLLDLIRSDEKFSTMQRRAAIWLMKTSGLMTSVMACFYYREWGEALADELQRGVHDINVQYYDRFIDCGNGFHLSHHTGGLDEGGHFNARFPARTLWVVEGDHMYPNHNDLAHVPGKNGLMIITPTLREIGDINLKVDA